MTTYSFTFANLTEWQAVEQIVAQENLDFGRQYKVYLHCKEGFRDVLLTVDKDGVWSYVSTKFPEDKMVLAGVTTVYADGEVEYHEEILTRAKFDVLKAATYGNPRYEDDGSFNGYATYEDLLANW